MLIDRLIALLSFGCKGSREGVPHLNYGCQLIHDFLERPVPFNRVLDNGAGFGDDLMLAKAINPQVEIHAIEAHLNMFIN